MEIASQVESVRFSREEELSIRSIQQGDIRHIQTTTYIENIETASIQDSINPHSPSTPN